MTTSPRNDELAAIRVLVDLHGDDGPDEWEPYHFDTAEVAARTLAGYLRRDGKRLSAGWMVKRNGVRSGCAVPEGEGGGT